MGDWGDKGSWGNLGKIMEILNVLYIITAGFLVLFAPGFSLSLVFFELGKIDLLERVALSFALSISVVPLLTFYLNLLGVKIGVGLVVLEVIGICFLSLGILIVKNYLRNQKG